MSMKVMGRRDWAARATAPKAVRAAASSVARAKRWDEMAVTGPLLFHGRRRGRVKPGVGQLLVERRQPRHEAVHLFDRRRDRLAQLTQDLLVGLAGNRGHAAHAPSQAAHSKA